MCQVEEVVAGWGLAYGGAAHNVWRNTPAISIVYWLLWDSTVSMVKSEHRLDDRLAWSQNHHVGKPTPHE